MNSSLLMISSTIVTAIFFSIRALAWILLRPGCLLVLHCIGAARRGRGLRALLVPLFRPTLFMRCISLWWRSFSSGGNGLWPNIPAGLWRDIARSFRRVLPIRLRCLFALVHMRCGISIRPILPYFLLGGRDHGFTLAVQLLALAHLRIAWLIPVVLIT